MRKILGLQKYKMTTHNLSFNISKDMSAFNIQLSFKMNIEPPENRYTFNIQPSLKLNVEPQENNSILQPIKQKNEKYQEQNNEQLIQILEAKKDILFEYVGTFFCAIPFSTYKSPELNSLILSGANTVSDSIFVDLNFANTGVKKNSLFLYYTFYNAVITLDKETLEF